MPRWRSDTEVVALLLVEFLALRRGEKALDLLLQPGVFAYVRFAAFPQWLGFFGGGYLLAVVFGFKRCNVGFVAVRKGFAGVLQGVVSEFGI